MPIRLWSVVVSQLATRPSYHAGRAGSTSVLTATFRSEARLQVADRRVHQLVVPRRSDRRHLPEAVAQQLAQRRWIAERRVRRDRGADQSLAAEAVARRADADERLLADAGRRLRCRNDLHEAAHRRVLDPAELGAANSVRADLLRLEPRVVRLAGDRVDLAAERG